VPARYVKGLSDGRAGRVVASRIKSDGMTPAQVAAQANKLPEGGTIADAGGENLQRLAEDLVTSPGRAANIVTSTLDKRQAGAAGRVEATLGQVLGQKPGGYHAARKEIARDLKTRSKPLYEAAEKVPVSITDNMRGMMGRPEVEAAMKTAAKTIRSGNKVTGGSFRFWDQVKKELDDAANKAFQKGAKNKGGRIANTGKELLAELDQQVPSYKAARALWQGDKKAEEALEAGRKFMREDAEITADMLKGMAEGERAMFKIGAARALRDKMLGRSDTADVAKAWFNNPLMRERIDALFDDPRVRAKLHRAMRSEQRMFETAAKAKANSATARRQEGVQNLARETLDDGLKGSGLAVTTLNAARKWVMQNLGWAKNERVRNEIAEAIMNTDPAQRVNVLTQLIQRRGMPNYLPGRGVEVSPLTGVLPGAAVNRMMYPTEATAP
jgi:hypothetical protein